MTKGAKSGLNHRVKEGLKMQFGYHIFDFEYCRFKTEQTPYTAIQLKERSKEEKTKQTKPRQDSCLDIYINRLGPGFLL